MDAYAFCVMCRDGETLNSSTGRIEKCPVCHGTSVVTPDDICYCGKSCFLEKDGMAYCGNEDCFKGLVRDKHWTPTPTYQNWGMHGRRQYPEEY